MKVRKIGKRWRSRSWTLSWWSIRAGESWQHNCRIISGMDTPRSVVIPVAGVGDVRFPQMIPAT